MRWACDLAATGLAVVVELGLEIEVPVYFEGLKDIGPTVR